MKRFLSLALCSALFGLGGGCTDCNGDAPPDAGPGLSDDEVVELCVLYSVGSSHYLEAQLQAFTACSAEDRFFELSDEERAEIAEGCVPGAFYYDIFEVAREGGRVEIDMARTRACAAKGKRAQEEAPIVTLHDPQGPFEPLFSDADCLAAITGLVDEGGECVQHWDCVEGLGCAASPPDSPTLRCLPPAEDGERCGGTRVCATGLNCTDEGTCAPAIAAGEDCRNDPIGGRSCAAGTFCDETGSGVCETLRAEGEACGADAHCADALGCQGANGSASPPVLGTCAAIPPGIADGAPCDPGADTCAALCSTCRRATAGGPTVCADRGGAGAYCEDSDACRSGFGCDLSTHECTELPSAPLPKLGESCDVDIGCGEGFCGDGVCVEGKAGDPCDLTYRECDDAHLCVEVAGAGVCTLLPRPGEPCLESECAAGAYCDLDRTCQTLRGAGAECLPSSLGTECISGTCLPGGTCTAPGPSCDETREWFVQLVILGFALPIALRLRRRRG